MGIFVEDTEAQAQQFLRTYPVSFPYGYDWKLTLARPLGFRGMPYTVVVSPKGEIAGRFNGPVSRADLVTMIETLRAER